MKIKTLFLALIILAIAAQARAVIYVRLSGGDYDNFQDAVDAAVSAGGTQSIIVGDGTYLGSGNYNILIDTDGLNLTIESENGPNNCVIDAQYLGRVFDIRNINGSDSVSIRGFTIKNGVAPGIYGGGGIYNHNSVLTLENCWILNNSSTKGGGIYSSAVVGSLVMNDCIVADNICTAGSGGGGMHIGNNTSITVTNCTFRNNSVSEPYMHAGGMYITSSSDVSFTNCLFEGNSAHGSGGVFYILSSNVDLTNCTLTGNKCTSNGGAAFMTEGAYTTTVNVKNCIFKDNQADNLGDNFYIVASPPEDANLNYSYSDIDTSLGSINGNGTWNDLGGNINIDPLFAQDGNWVGTTWVSGDYHLQSMVGRWDPNLQDWVIDVEHSPCIDAGDPSDSVGDEPAGYNGNRINMGFYGGTTEASKSPTCTEAIPGDLNDDCRVNFYDFAIMASNWLECNLDPESFCWE